MNIVHIQIYRFKFSSFIDAAPVKALILKSRTTVSLFWLREGLDANIHYFQAVRQQGLLVYSHTAGNDSHII